MKYKYTVISGDLYLALTNELEKTLWELMSLSVNRFSFPRNQLLRRFNRRINTGVISVKSSVRPDTISADD